MHSAIALFVKNEVQDIAAWIAWHLSLGIDKIFIYDDHSVDGTFEIACLFARFYNVEVFRTDLKIQHFYWRQADSYKKACRESIGKYDWISFLDGDEYISLEKETSINQYLEKFSEFNGIALSWRIYGSNGRVVKSKEPPYVSYTRHCTKDLSDCEIGKVFIRPEAFTFDYGSPHHLTLIDEKYANSLGEELKFTHGPSHPIIWEGACVNHYVIRSMQDFVEKISKRINADMTDSDGYWNHFNMNVIETHPSPEVVSRSQEVIAFLKVQSVKYFLKSRYAIDLLEAPPTQEKSSVYQVISEHNAPFFLKKNAIVPTQNFHHLGSDGNEVLCVRYEENPRLFYFFSVEQNQVSTKTFYFLDDNRLASTLPFELVDEGGSFLFKSPNSGLYMCCLPENIGGKIEVNREYASLWEKFCLEEVQRENVFFVSCPSKVSNVETFEEYLRDNERQISYGDFLIAWNKLDPSSKDLILHSGLGNILKWL